MKFAFSAIDLQDEILSDNDLIFIPEKGFLTFENQIWEPIQEEAIKFLCKEKLSEEANSFRINETLNMLRSETYLEIKKLNANRNRLVLLNGTLDISDWKNPVFYENEYFKEDYTTTKLNISFQPDNNDYPSFIKYLSTTFNDNPELINLIGEILGYCLTPSTKFHKAFFFNGSGSNGKSVLLTLIEMLLTRQNVSNFNLSNLDSSFARSSLYGKLVNLSSEMESSSKDIGYFKQIVAGDTINAEEKYKPSFTFRPYCKLLFAMNNLPYIKDKSDGFYRRIIIIPFENKFTESTPGFDRDLDSKLEKELNAIFNFALEGIKRLAKNNGFTRSEKCEQAMRNYRVQNNPIEQFFEDEVVFEEVSKILCSDLYRKYTLYAKDNGFYPVNNANFGKEVLRLFPVLEPKRLRVNGERKNYYVGISV